VNEYPTLTANVAEMIARFETMIDAPGTDNALGSLNFLELESIANVIASAGRVRFAATLVYAWLLADGDHGADVDPATWDMWMRRLPQDYLNTYGPLSTNHYNETGLYLPWYIDPTDGIAPAPRPNPGDSFERFGVEVAAILGSADDWSDPTSYLEAINEAAIKHLGLQLGSEDLATRHYFNDLADANGIER